MDFIKIEKDTSTNVDLLLNGINFTGGLLALSALKAKLKVAIKLPAEFDFSFQPELSNFYPMSVIDSVKAIGNFNFLMNCSSLFPHHFYPQRILMFNDRDTFNKSLNNTFDMLLKRDRESAALPIRTEKYEAYKNLSDAYMRGSLVYEYRFDRNRAVLDLLKMCKKNGAIILKNDEELNGEVELKCKPFQRINYSFEFENTSWPYPNSIHFQQKNFSVLFLAFEQKIIVQVNLYETEMEYDHFYKEIIQILACLKLPKLSNQEKLLKSIFDKQQNLNSENINEVLDTSLNDLRSNTINVIKRLSSSLGKKIELNRAWQSFRGNEMNHDNFRLIQNECDEKFDLAKQTGINYNHFILLFYRYRFDIDHMIEFAYDLMSEERDPVKIWSRVEMNFLSKELADL